MTRLVFILGAALLSFLFSCRPSYVKGRYKIKRPMYTHAICTVDGSYMYFNWEVNGDKRRVTVRGYGDKSMNGKVFNVIYDAQHPNNNYILQDQQLFLPHEHTTKTMGMVYRSRKYDCFFLFNKDFAGWSYVPKGKGIKKGDKFEVEYLPQNPERCAIDFEKSATIQIPAYGSGVCIEYMEGIWATFQFEIKGKRYTAYSLSQPHMVIGDRFKIVYDTLHPEHANVLLDQPMFLPSEHIGKSIGTLLKVTPEGCEFYYLPEKHTSKKYKKYQSFQADSLGDYSNLKKGDKFEVDFSPSHLERAIIYLNRPLR